MCTDFHIFTPLSAVINRVFGRAFFQLPNCKKLSKIVLLSEKHHFPYNIKVFSKGIPFLNYEQEAVLAEELRRRRESSRSQTTVLPSSIR